MDQEFAMFTVLSSYPLSHGFENGPPARNCSGTVVEYEGRRLLLTVAHAVKPNEAWAIGLGYEPSKGMQLYKVGVMQHMIEIARGKGRVVDFCFCMVPQDFAARWQSFSDQGQVVHEADRVILLSDLSSAPRPGERYGFAGLTRPTIEPAPPGRSHAIAGFELAVETGLTFLETVDGLDKYDLGHPHPGHEHYRGCSGSPVLAAESGKLVGLVVSGCEAEGTISALPLRNYRGAVIAALAANG